MKNSRIIRMMLGTIIAIFGITLIIYTEDIVLGVITIVFGIIGFIIGAFDLCPKISRFLGLRKCSDFKDCSLNNTKD